MIEAIQGVAAGQEFIAPLQAVKPPVAGNVQEPAGGGGALFGQMVSTGLQGVNQQLLTSQADLQQLATGDVQNLHQIMIRLEESRVSFQLTMQVRNRLLEAYQDIMKMQV